MGPILAWDNAAVAVCCNICSLIELDCSLANSVSIILLYAALLVVIALKRLVSFPDNVLWFMSNEFKLEFILLIALSICEEKNLISNEFTLTSSIKSWSCSTKPAEANSLIKIVEPFCPEEPPALMLSGAPSSIWLTSNAWNKWLSVEFPVVKAPAIPPFAVLSPKGSFAPTSLLTPAVWNSVPN